jgi:DNA-binding SARP family transcriptional activator/tetratricopeptide (TPR) repeat protein
LSRTVSGGTEYRLLGSLEVRTGDGSLPLGGTKQRALLALLLLNANRIVGRERLIDELWDESPPDSAVTSVQVYVSRLRKLLPDGALSTRSPGYVLTVEPEAVDLQRFQGLVEKARGAPPGEAAGLLREALALWRGPALAEFGETPFGRVEAGRLEELRLGALEARIEADLALGHHDELIGELESLCVEEPHRERLCGQLMVALYRSGRQAEALEVYRRMRAALDELGLEPSAPLRQLELQILNQDGELDAPHVRPLTTAARVPLPGPLLPDSPFPFVGRTDELARLGSLLDQAEAGKGGLVLLAGEAGSGKTRLVRELAVEAASRGALVLYGTSDAVVVTPYQPLREWLEFLLDFSEPETLAELLGAGAGELARLVPGLATSPRTGEGEIDRFLLLSAVDELFKGASRDRLLLVVFDDLHWADGETLHLLRHLARRAPTSRLLVVTAFRDRGEPGRAELTEALADLARLEAVTRLTLGNLDEQAVGEFIRRSADAEPTAQLASAIGELSDGTPLLLCELWRHLVESGGVEIAKVVSQTRPLAELHRTERMGDLVEQRLARFDPETLELLELAAVVGPRFELRVLARAAGAELGALIGELDRIRGSGMIEELPASVPTCRFTHELVRRAVYDRLGGLRRAELHLRVGEALELAYAADPSGVLPELAHHFTVAAPLGGAERAVGYNLRAAEAAAASGAYREAAARLSSALELGINDSRERARVQAELGYLFFEIGRMSESDALLTASIEAAAVLGERGLAARALVHRSNQRLASDPDASSAEVVPIAEEAIRTFEELGDTRGLAAAEHLLGHALGREGRDEECLAALDRALAHAEAAGDQVMLRHIVGRFCRRLCDGGAFVAEATDRLEKLRSYTRSDPALDAGLRRYLAFALAMSGRPEEAWDHIRASNPILEEVVESDLAMTSRLEVAEAMVLLGDLAAAESELAALFSSMRDSRGRGPESRALRVAGEVALLLCDQGRWDDAAGYLEYGREVDTLDPVRGKMYPIVRLAARGRLAAQGGELTEALAFAERAVECGENTDYLNYVARAWLALAEVRRAGGEAESADAAVARAIELYERKGNIVAAERLRQTTGAD